MQGVHDEAQRVHRGCLVVREGRRGADLRVVEDAPSRRLSAVPQLPFRLIGGPVEGGVVGAEPRGVVFPGVLAQTVPLGVDLGALREGAGPRLQVTRRKVRRQGLRAAGHAPPICGADHVGRARAARARLGIERAGVGRAYWVDAEERHVQVLASGVLGLRFWHQSEEQVAAHELLEVCVLEVDRRDEGPRPGRGDLLGDGRGRLGQGDDDLVGLRGRA